MKIFVVCQESQLLCYFTDKESAEQYAKRLGYFNDIAEVEPLDPQHDLEAFRIGLDENCNVIFCEERRYMDYPPIEKVTFEHHTGLYGPPNLKYICYVTTIGAIKARAMARDEAKKHTVTEKELNSYLGIIRQ
jgi:hypothetical protein